MKEGLFYTFHGSLYNYPIMKNSILFLLCCFSILPVFAQQSSNEPLLDSIFQRPTELDLDSGKVDPTPSLEELIRKTEEYTIQTNRLQIQLQDKIDTLMLSSGIQEMSQSLETLRQRFNLSSFTFNLRYIGVINRFLESNRIEFEEYEKTIKNKSLALSHADSLLKSIREDIIFDYLPKDTATFTSYWKKVNYLREQVKELSNEVFQQELLTAQYQTELSSIKIESEQLKEYIAIKEKQINANLFKQEINPIWKKSAQVKQESILEITQQSVRLNGRFLFRYFNDHSTAVILSFFIILGIYLGMHLVLRQTSEKKKVGDIILKRVTFFRQRPFSAVMVSILPLLVFLFERNSVTFLSFILFLQLIFTTVLIEANYPKRVLIKWLLISLFFVYCLVSNLYWEIAFNERYYLLLGSFIPLYFSWEAFRKFESTSTTEQNFIKRLSFLTFILLTLGVFLNILGWFSFSKILTISATIGFIHGVSLYFFVIVIMEAIYLLLENSKKEKDHFTSYFDYQGIQRRLKGTFLLVAFLLWASILLQNLSIQQPIIESVSDFLSKERFIGNSSFTFGSIFLFGIILYVTMQVANTIAYFISLRDQKNASSREKKLGSSILIIRLAVFTIGFFLATVASSIPLDKITIVLGALSVGIGFGLQTIINNLVSGIILAFERPIQIGDEIQVGQNSGTVKEVGIRASKIQAYDGSEIVVPNGDLLSQSLINWTLSDKRRRVELIIGVSYDSDMSQVKSTIEEILTREKILKFPVPKVYMQTFNDSSVDFRVLFWVESMDIWLQVRSEVMIEIFEAFKAKGIEIPYPKRDLYLKNLGEIPGTVQNKPSSPAE